MVCSDRPDGGYGEVDAEVVCLDRMLDGQEVKLALSGEVLTTEAEHGGTIGQHRLKGMLKPTDPHSLSRVHGKQISVAHPPQRCSRTPVQSRAFCG